MNNDSNQISTSNTILLVSLLLIALFSVVIIALFSGDTVEENVDKALSNSDTNINGVVDVYIQDQTTDLVDLYLSRLIADINITQDTSLDQNWVLIESNVLPVIDNLVCLKENKYFYQGFIINFTVIGVNQYNISLDSPLDYAFTVDGGCSLRDHDLSVDGSVTPQVFSVTPGSLDDDVNWDIVRLMFYVADDQQMDGGLFGGIPALSKGLVVRKKDGVYKNFFNIKSNGEFAQRSYDVSYDTQARPPTGTDYTLTSRRTFGGQNKNGIVIRLSSFDGDELQAIVQDDLTSLSHVHIIAQGHVVEN